MLVSAEDFVPGMEVGAVPTPDAILRPDPLVLFQKRADRLRVLARDHTMGDFLSFLAILADGQHDLVRQGVDRWRQALGPLLDRVAVAPGLPPQVGDAVRALAVEEDGRLDQRVARWLAGMPDTADLAGAPFIAAALQVERSMAAVNASPAPMGRDRCPVCGGAPLASTVATHNQVEGVRYLHCSLCATAWHLERLRCAQCYSDGKVVYRRLEGGDKDVAAETCDHCGVYVKVFHLDGHPDWELLAEDVASIALDLRLGDDGWRRLWPNPFLHGA